ncbi:MAG TPA: translation initiation factor IF-2 [candidate division WOR-3 bacterium]|uniref:Translation initiation factor IF-2 n=1 Tax=candidate division WOR-3 bacterium TaxID=2052148 RepID=A0A9C9EMY3_UNCW3|nr:translation initiation factor IF-2 [candidate division WOR-3 bacterium]
MPRKKVYNVAKNLGLSSAALIKLLDEIGIKAKGHMSSLSEEEIKKVRAKISEEKKRVKKEFTRRYTKPKAKEKKRKIDKEAIRETVKSTLAKLEKKETKKHYKRDVVHKVEVKPSEKVVDVVDFMTVAELSQALKMPTSEVIKKCLDMGLMVSLNQRLDIDTITLLCDEFGYSVRVISVEEQLAPQADVEKVARPPVVTIMGHVDHGKTTLLDAITKLRVVEEEYGKITQRMAAYQITYHDKTITFLDTPGHEAFTAMRARGAQVTDIVILVVAADDGVMPQTVEAIDHARAANVPIIVCINKIDLPGANVNLVKTQLAKANVVIEEFGGNSICVETSALKGVGIPDLLDAILVKAEELELKAPVKKAAKGVVIEARLDRGKGNVSTILVQEGMLHKGDPFVCGPHFGRVRELLDEKMNRVKEAGPSTPVLVLGFSGLPQAGEVFLAVDNERRARELAYQRQLLDRNRTLRAKSKVTLLDLQEKIKSGETKELKVILKADSAGSVEVLDEKLNELNMEDVGIRIVHKGVGKINVSDILLAEVTGAICVGFHVGPDTNALEAAEREGVEIRTYRLIYEALDDLRSAMLGMLEPTIKEILIGEAEIREVFNIPKLGVVAGCYIKDGKVTRNAVARVIREGKEILKSKVISLKRFKDDVKEVLAGYECGVGLENAETIEKGDTIQFYKIEESTAADGG